ncbi:AraC family transcriptional regulator [Echinicola jeungdonensis]|nr:AraC family transcriptional regulator [Echinicola jeungdonensis]MDN3670481.1 AraC family transcriptional regulator [Echinicola jeungdonensis]
MLIENIPDLFLSNLEKIPEVFIHDFRMTSDIVKSKINLRMNMFSFLQVGKKHVHFGGSSVKVDKSQSLLIKKGNCLWTELLDTEKIYYCKLLFFSEKILKTFLEKHVSKAQNDKKEIPFFTIENDHYITNFLNSLSAINEHPSLLSDDFLSIKFEEIMLYLCCKYGSNFKSYLQSLVVEETSPFKEIVERNVYSNLRLEEIAFLCNMSLSTFKRHFINEYKASPGKWLQEKRLEKAKTLLEQGHSKASDIYLEIGYNNLSNFSSAFKNKFGFSPKDT